MQPPSIRQDSGRESSDRLRSGVSLGAQRARGRKTRGACMRNGKLNGRKNPYLIKSGSASSVTAIGSRSPIVTQPGSPPFETVPGSVAMAARYGGAGQSAPQQI